MSSNDQLWIVKDKDGLYSIYVDSCVDNPFDWREETPYKVVKTREEAEKIAYDWNAEYGEVWLDGESKEKLDKELDDWSEVDRLNTELRKLHQKNVELGDEIMELKKEASLYRKLMTEIDCRIQHGANSNGHLEGLVEIMRKEEKI